MKKQFKKLQLNRETLHVLGENSLLQAMGGSQMSELRTICDCYSICCEDN